MYPQDPNQPQQPQQYQQPPQPAQPYYPPQPPQNPPQSPPQAPQYPPQYPLQAPPPYQQPPKKSHTAIILGIVAAAIIAILLLLLLLPMLQDKGGGESINGVHPPGEEPLNGSSTTQPSLPATDPSILTASGFETKISRVTLNDDRSLIKEIELHYASNPAELEYDNYNVKFDLFDGDRRVSGFSLVFTGRPNAEFELFKKTGAREENYRSYTLLHTTKGEESGCEYSQVTTDGPRSVMVETWGMSGGYCSILNSCSTYWYPCDVGPGEYTLRVVVLAERGASRNWMTLGYLETGIQLGPDAPKIQ
jgi:hypothetical protein